MGYLTNIKNKKHFNKYVGERFQSIRAKYNLTQEDLAELLDISISTVSRIERGNYKITLFLSLELCEKLNLSLEQFLDLSDKDKTNDTDFLNKFRGSNSEILSDFCKELINFYKK